jgi:UDP-glucose 4-epimerase
VLEAFARSTVLITGGAGFIGSNLALRLVDLGAQVTLVDSLIPEYGGNLANIEPIADRVRLNIADVRDEHAMKHLVRGQDYLFNLAGQTSHADSMEDPFTDLEINARAQLSILEACRRHNPDIRIVYASTRQIYGRPERLPVDEMHPLAPVDVNGINKLAGEQYHRLYSELHGLRSCTLRLTNTYGPRMRVVDARQTFLGIWVRNLIDNKPLQVFGTGRQIRDYNFVDDVVEALLIAATSESAVAQIYNLGSEEVKTLVETAELMIEVFEGGSFELVPFPEDRKRIDIGDYYADTRKIERELGWRPHVSLRDGLARTLDYFSRNTTSYW